MAVTQLCNESQNELRGAGTRRCRLNNALLGRIYAELSVMAAEMPMTVYVLSLILRAATLASYAFLNFVRRLENPPHH